MNPVICMVAPNGARRIRSDHEQIPLDAEALARTASLSVKEGATAIHVHVRDDNGRHSLSVELYRQAIESIRRACGDDLFIQVTTESAGIYDVHQQIAMVYQLQPQAVSLSVTELARAEPDEISALDHWMHEKQILPQWIIYSEVDLQRYTEWLDNGVLCGSAYPVLFVLGSYRERIDADIDMLYPFLSSTDRVSSWMVCAFGFREQVIMKQVIGEGGHIRVGFENNLWLTDKVIAKDNAELVALNIASIREHDSSVATVEQTRRLLTPDW